MGGCQNYGPLLGPLNIRCRIIPRTQKGTIVMTTTHMSRGVHNGFVSVGVMTYLCIYGGCQNMKTQLTSVLP